MAVAAATNRSEDERYTPGLTAADLGLSKPRGLKAGAAGKPNAKKSMPRKARKGGVAKYRGPDGKTWTGHGRAPGWFKAALEAGATRERLAV